MALGIAKGMQGSGSTLAKALANPKVSSLAKSLDIDLGNENTVNSLLVRVTKVLGQTAATRGLTGYSAAFSLGFSRVVSIGHIPAVLQAYREIDAL
jgi:hypothetical protein